VTIQNEADLTGLQRVGDVVRQTLAATTAAVAPGVRTMDLDAIAEDIYRHHGARSAPTLQFGFPGHILVSVEDEVVHGIPGDRVLAAGDIVTVDVTVELDGYVADAARTVCLPPVSAARRQLATVGEQALRRGIDVARAGQPVADIGGAVHRCVQDSGLTVIRELTGHGTGRAIWEDPMVPSFRSTQSERLHAGLVLTIEPIITSGTGAIYEAPDGWTVRTRDRAPAAHWEETIVITDAQPLVLTN
jgi:methionyl aminopeptidase